MSYLQPREDSPALSDASQVLAAALKEMDSIIASAEVDSTENRNSYGNAVYRSLERPSKSYGLEPVKPQVLENYRINDFDKRDTGDVTEQLSLRSENIDLKKELFGLQQTVAMQRAEIESLNQELYRRRAQLEAAEEQLMMETRLRRKIENEKLQLMSDAPALKLKLMRSEKERMELTTRLRALQTGFQRTLSNLTAADLSGTRSGTPTRADKPPLPRPTLSPTVYSNTIAASPSAQRKANQRFPQTLYSTLPRNYKPPPNIGKQVQEKSHNGLRTLDGRSTSAPELNNPDRVVKPLNPTQPIISHTSGPKKFLKLFGKLSRSNSASNSSIGSFKRNTSTRATAMPRLCGWKSNEHLKRPLREWDKKCIISFFQQLDLYDLYDGPILAVTTGHGLEDVIRSEAFQATIKHPMHRRKLLLAIDVFVANDSLLKSAICLDTKWALSWLDDLGLPQYTDAFQEARVDGLILHNMTLEDAGVLKIHSQVALLSLKWGIYTLRSTNFDPGCLKRRAPENPGMKESIDEIALWTNHRVMQWLRDIDFAEYAPNLRGSGIHGALLVYEDSLGENLLSELLNIAPSKTLLRKHLVQQLKELLGNAIIQRKRGVQATTSVPLSPSTKVKFPKGTLGRRNKKRCDQTLVCPQDLMGYLPSSDCMSASMLTMTSSTHSSLSSNSNP